MDDVIIRMVSLPASVKGFTIPDEDGDYNVYLNDRLDREELLEAYTHELGHIEQGHFWDDTKTVQEKEEPLGSKPRGVSNAR